MLVYSLTRAQSYKDTDKVDFRTPTRQITVTGKFIKNILKKNIWFT